MLKKSRLKLKIQNFRFLWQRSARNTNDRCRGPPPCFVRIGREPRRGSEGQKTGTRNSCKSGSGRSSYRTSTLGRGWDWGRNWTRKICRICHFRSLSLHLGNFSFHLESILTTILILKWNLTKNLLYTRCAITQICHREPQIWAPLQPSGQSLEPASGTEVRSESLDQTSSRYEKTHSQFLSR